MSRGTAFVVFGLGFLLAFGSTAILSYLGSNPLWVWGLFFLSGLWFWQLPALREIDPKLTLICLYAFPFMALWLLSSPTHPGDIKTFIAQMIVFCLLLAALAAAMGAATYYRHLPGLRPTIQAAVPLLCFAWLVAFFSSSTGASSHMIGFLQREFGLTTQTADSLVEVFRKSMHFLFYGSFGWLSYRVAVRGGANRAVPLALAFVLFHCSFDEVRQSGFADRTGSFWDVCLDMAGAICFVLIANAISDSKTKRAPAARGA